MSPTVLHLHCISTCICDAYCITCKNSRGIRNFKANCYRWNNDSKYSTAATTNCGIFGVDLPSWRIVDVICTVVSERPLPHFAFYASDVDLALYKIYSDFWLLSAPLHRWDLILVSFSNLSRLSLPARQWECVSSTKVRPMCAALHGAATITGCTARPYSHARKHS